jgi:hypothetical protein
LRREHGWLLAVLELQASLHDLGEGEGVARAAVRLVTVVGSEIEAVIFTPIERLWQVLVRNSLRVNVVLHVSLGFSDCLDKLGVLHVSELILVHLVKALKRG